MSTSAAPEKVDHLGEDPAIRGQKYVCLSFISPEEVIASRHEYVMEQFLAKFQDSMREFVDGIERVLSTDCDEARVKDLIKGVRTEYAYILDRAGGGGDDVSPIVREHRFFATENEARLSQAFNERTGGKTSVRGVKVRGTYETLAEAQKRAMQLKKIDPAFHIYVGAVGQWLPWYPNPSDVEGQEYGDDDLNELMKSYMDNQAKRDEFYAQRKQHMVTTAREEGRKGKRETDTGDAGGSGSGGGSMDAPRAMFDGPAEAWRSSTT